MKSSSSSKSNRQREKGQGRKTEQLSWEEQHQIASLVDTCSRWERDYDDEEIHNQEEGNPYHKLDSNKRDRERQHKYQLDRTRESYDGYNDDDEYDEENDEDDGNQRGRVSRNRYQRAGRRHGNRSTR